MKKTIATLLLISAMSCTLMVKTVNKSKDLEGLISDTDLSIHANQYFWKNFHNGDYSKIDSMLYYLSASYNQNPNHLETVSHLGFTHMWALTERQKNNIISPIIIDHGILALKYFGEAYRLNPKDPRILGFLADAKMTVANFSDDKKLLQEGFFDGKKSIRQWKEFNYFTVGYLMSRLDYDSWQFKKALEWQWETLDICFCETVDRENPNTDKAIELIQTGTDLKKQRACWNSWIAPHNTEGFYLNMGDMIVKSGDWEKGIKIYNLAKKVPEYNTWPFKNFLEKRIANAKINVEKFRKPIISGKKYNNHDVTLVNTSISCMSCHNKSEQDFEIAKINNFDWEKYKEKNNVYWMNEKK